MQKYAVIVAGGSGSRMKSKLPKQFIEIGGLPILMHTISAFRAYMAHMPIKLVLPAAEQPLWYSLCAKHHFDQQNIEVVNGGASRYQSCKAGIMSITASEALVAVHDGVRPFVNKAVIEAGFNLAQSTGTAVCSVESKDSVRLLDADTLHNKALERSRVQLVQTPQIFTLDILQKAYMLPEQSSFTDDASVVESAGFDIQLFAGNIENIKITNPIDLALAEIILSNDF